MQLLRQEYQRISDIQSYQHYINVGSASVTYQDHSLSNNNYVLPQKEEGES